MTERERPRAIQVAAQAKINLRLRILAREEDGYHQLETLMLRLELADTVRVRRTAGPRSLDVSGDADEASLGPTERNLAWRAAEAYFAASGMDGGFAIELEKRIPIGGGLGGGSADAGAVFRALDAMAETPLGEARLIGLGSTLGSDVPFLASEHAYALAWGRGERMLALEPPPVRGVLLSVPAFSVNTAEAYGWLAAARSEGAERNAPRAAMLHPPLLSHWAFIARCATNDFEPVVAARHPEIATILSFLRAAPALELALMSGSGSSVFGIGREGGEPLREPSNPSHVGGTEITTRTASRVETPSPIV